MSPCFPVVAQSGRALKKQILSGILTAILSLGAQMLPVRIRPTGLWDSLTEAEKTPNLQEMGIQPGQRLCGPGYSSLPDIPCDSMPDG